MTKKQIRRRAIKYQNTNNGKKVSMSEAIAAVLKAEEEK